MRALAALLLAVSLLACDPGVEGRWDEPLPELDGARTARTREPLTVAQTPDDLARARLEQQLHELEAWLAEAQRPLEQRMARWTKLASVAAGTDYGAIAQARVAVLDRELADRCVAAASASTADYLEEKWKQGRERLRQLLVTYGDREATGPVRQRLELLERFRGGQAKAWRIRVGYGREASWKQQPGPGKRYWVEGARAVGPRPNKGWRELVFAAPGQSMNRYGFHLERQPSAMYLITRQHVAKAGDRYAPITITINGRMVASRFNAVTPGGAAHTRTAWRVTDHVRRGKNWISFQLADDALTVFWLNGFELTEQSPEGLLAVR